MAVEHFVISCPWCGRYTDYDDEDLDAIAVPNVAAARRLLGDERHQPADYRLLTCKTPGCLAPFEACICRGRETAQEVQRQLQWNVWSGPRRFRLRKNDKGDRFNEFFGVLFNRNALERWKNIHLRDMVDIGLVTKSLLGFAMYPGMPLTLFEARVAGDEIFWIPIEAASRGDQRLPVNMRANCLACRTAFDEAVERELATLSHGPACRYYETCPARSCCGSPGSQDPRPGTDCLLRLDLRRRRCPCYSSDLSIIDAVVKQFKRNSPQDRWNTQDPWPVFKECWAGNMEAAFPIIVHDHLAGILMTGQFMQTQTSPSPSDLIEREREWRRQHPDLPPDAVLPTIFDQLHKATLAPVLPVGEWSSLGNLTAPVNVFYTKPEDLRRLFGLVHSDAEHVERVANDRYRQQRDQMEGAFRRELTGRLASMLFKASTFEDFLKDILERMRSFWAFKRVCLLMGPEWETEVRLFATDEMFLNATTQMVLVGHHMEREYGARGILLLPSGLAQCRTQTTEDEQWQEFVDQLASSPFSHYDASDQTYIVHVRTGSRYYTFCFNGRIKDSISPLPSRPQQSLALPAGMNVDDVRLSDECQEQVMRTCQSISERLHEFVARSEREGDYQALAHTLKSPVVIMRGPGGLIAHLLREFAPVIQPSNPMLFDKVQAGAQRIQVGADILADEVKRLELWGFFEDRLSQADKGRVDLIDLLDSLKPQFTLLGLAHRKSWRLRSAHVKSAWVRGDPQLVRVAVRNILDNAYKYSERGTPITLRVRHRKGKWYFRVRNLGPLIRPEELPKVAQKGFRGVNARGRKTGAEGTGLGLYLVRRVVERLGGRLVVRCRPTGKYGSVGDIGNIRVLTSFPCYEGGAQ